MKQLCVGAEVIAQGSAIECHHYFRSLYLHKECFDVLCNFNRKHYE